MYEIYAKLRDEKNVTDYRIAKECGFNQAILVRWKQGTTKPSLDTMLAIAKFFDVTVDFLIGGG